MMFQVSDMLKPSLPITEMAEVVTVSTSHNAPFRADSGQIARPATRQRYTKTILASSVAPPAISAGRNSEGTANPRSQPRPVSASSLGDGFGSFERQVIALTNQERLKRGLSALKLNSQLNQAAEQHSADMAKKNYFSHQGRDGSQPWDRMQSQGYSYIRAAENIATGQSSPQQVVNDWMNSAGHRKNILDPNLKEIGVGYYKGYWTQNFGTPRRST